MPRVKFAQITIGNEIAVDVAGECSESYQALQDLLAKIGETDRRLELDLEAAVNNYAIDLMAAAFRLGWDCSRAPDEKYFFNRE